MKLGKLILNVFSLLGFLFAINGVPGGVCEKLKIGASPTPHAEILNFVKSELEKEGVELEIIEFTDYITPNIALGDKQLDANFFQHKPYLDNFAKERDIALISLGTIHIEPMGLYSKKIKNIKELKEGAIIAIPNDPTNEGRALLLLQSSGLIKLRPNAGFECTPLDIVSNPKNLKFKELEAAQLPRVLDDVDGAIINGHYAIEAKLNPLKNALLLEKSNSPYANVVAVRLEAKDDPGVQKLMKALKSDKVRQYIINTYKGGVIPTF
ncbi:MAG: MetQ/NlpA family ABC transporter substrate-binding protein [Holosporales bacterium]|jgi:D-methionine transport system substrate-binding protein|nr:MetQ/NlpA family ABC transporter substrate-binding protein [Holosporales bacterium]